VPVEVCMLIGRDEEVLWADRSSEAAALPDSRARWEAIWWHREHLEVVAHSHPNGPLAFSATDRSTMAAIDEALSEPRRFAVVSREGVIWGSAGRTWRESADPWWADLLRWASGMAGR
jgi:proteasome lid subunit RPN8/RPN11